MASIVRPASGWVSGSSSAAWCGRSRLPRCASLRPDSTKSWWSKKSVRCSSTRSRKNSTTGATMSGHASMASSTKRTAVAVNGRCRAASGCCRRLPNCRRRSSLERSVPGCLTLASMPPGSVGPCRAICVRGSSRDWRSSMPASRRWHCPTSPRCGHPLFVRDVRITPRPMCPKARARLAASAAITWRPSCPSGAPKPSPRWAARACRGSARRLLPMRRISLPIWVTVPTFIPGIWRSGRRLRLVSTSPTRFSSMMRWP